MKVAIAGGGSSVGRHIAEAILIRKNHSLTILSRRPLPDLEQLGAHVALVDFLSQDSLSDALVGVHTVISALGMRSGLDKAVEIEVGLVQAAQKAGVKRFLSNGWAGNEEGPDDPVAVYRLKQPALAALGTSGMQWSFPVIGIFLNYFSTPKPGTGYLRPAKFWIDIENCSATIPGDGTKEVVYTAVEDVGEFVAEALDIEDWPQKMCIAGHRLSMNEVIKIGEQIRGKAFSVTYQQEEDLKALLIPDPPSPFTNLLAELSISLIHGRYTFDANLAEVAVRFTRVDEFIQQWWGEISIGSE